MRKARFAELYTKETLQALYSVMDQSELCKATGFETKCIQRHLKKWGIQKRARGRSCPWTLLDEDTELINYFGGFGYADGSFRKTSITGYTLKLSLSEKDQTMINILHNSIVGSKYYEYIDGVGKRMVSLTLNGIDLPEKLLRFGITNNKRYNWTRPTISDAMLPHFLRGWFDGDGCIEKKPKMTLTNINKEAIEYFDEKIRFLGYTPDLEWYNQRDKVLPPNHIKEYKYGDNKTVYRHIVTGKKNCEMLYSILKGDSALRLDRKWSLLER